MPCVFSEPLYSSLKSFKTLNTPGEVNILEQVLFNTSDPENFAKTDYFAWG